jgi:glycosyltransferase involved in cell wall biosynthesis
LRSLRVLFLATRDWYNPQTTGGDNTLWENARYLASVGHRVTFVCGTFPGATTETTLDGIRVVRVGGIHSLWARTFIYYMTKCRGRYDVVVTEGFGGSRIPRFAPLYVKEPVITAWHQVHRDLFRAQYPRLLMGPLNVFERITAWVHRNTKVQAYTPESIEAFTRIGFRAENVFVVPVSIRDEWLSEANRASDHTEPTLLWIGKLRRYKCPDHVIRAMAAVVMHVPSARLIIAARRDDRSYEQQMRRLVSDLGLDNNVEFKFNVSEDEKRSLVAASRVLVVPSSVEGFGIVVLEANAYGVPVVASSGVPEGAVREGGNGLRYPFGNIPALSDRIVQVLTDDELYSRLSAESLRFVSHFGWREVSRQFEQVLERTVRDASRQRHSGSERSL